MSNSPYPLAWPAGRPRTAAHLRKFGKFGKSVPSSKPGGMMRKADLTVADALDRLQHEVDRLKGDYAVISTNIPARLDGKPRSNMPDPVDPGVALYFTLNGKPICMPCDRYDRVADNIAAIAAHIEATRAIERHGVGTAAEALMAFTALPAPRGWREVMGFGPGAADREAIETRFRQLAIRAHPDAGGSTEAMSELNLARAAALKEAHGNG